MSDTDAELDLRADSRSQHRATRSARHADVRLPERRPNPLARLRDPFDDDPPTIIRQRRIRERRVHDQERLSSRSSFVALPDDEPLAPLPHQEARLERDRLMAELLATQPVYRSVSARRTARSWRFPWLLLTVCLVSLIVLFLVWSETGTPRICLAPGCIGRPQTTLTNTFIGQPPTINGQHSVLGPPSISAQQIDRILAEWQSPAAGTGSTWIELGVRYGIDPAYALAFFIHESGAGTAPGWAGRKPDGRTTHNIGNIICAGYKTCYGRFRDYANWKEGIEDWYRLIAVEYVEWRGVHTVEEIIPIYAPAIENNVPTYIDTVNRLVAEWRTSRTR
ncbi:MAG: glucosaminidase domain-containing protein [Roseiflexus sp.]